MDYVNFAVSYLARTKNAMNGFDVNAFKKIVETLKLAQKRSNRVFVFGNGGSSATADHMVGDLSQFCDIQCLSDNIPIVTAVGNDFSYDDIFDYQLRRKVRFGDVIIGISGSGNSENVVRAFSEPLKNSVHAIAITGMGGGRLAPLCDTAFIVDSDDMQHIEDVHMILVHMIMRALKKHHEESKIDPGK